MRRFFLAAVAAMVPLLGAAAAQAQASSASASATPPVSAAPSVTTPAPVTTSSASPSPTSPLICIDGPTMARYAKCEEDAKAAAAKKPEPSPVGESAPLAPRKLSIVPTIVFVDWSLGRYKTAVDEETGDSRRVEKPGKKVRMSEVPGLTCKNPDWAPVWQAGTTTIRCAPVALKNAIHWLDEVYGPCSADMSREVCADFKSVRLASAKAVFSEVARMQLQVGTGLADWAKRVDERLEELEATVKSHGQKLKSHGEQLDLVVLELAKQKAALMGLTNMGETEWDEADEADVHTRGREVVRPLRATARVAALGLCSGKADCQFGGDVGLVGELHLPKGKHATILGETILTAEVFLGSVSGEKTGTQRMYGGAVGFRKLGTDNVFYGGNVRVFGLSAKDGAGSMPAGAKIGLPDSGMGGAGVLQGEVGIRAGIVEVGLGLFAGTGINRKYITEVGGIATDKSMVGGGTIWLGLCLGPNP